MHSHPNTPRCSNPFPCHMAGLTSEVMATRLPPGNCSDVHERSIDDTASHTLHKDDLDAGLCGTTSPRSAQIVAAKSNGHSSDHAGSLAPGNGSQKQAREPHALLAEIARLRKLLERFDDVRPNPGTPYPDMALQSHLLPDAP